VAKSQNASEFRQVSGSIGGMKVARVRDA